MGVLNEAMRRLVKEQKLGFVATVSADGSPNVSPKGTIAVWDPDHLVFADLASPKTVENLRSRPAVEVNVVDPFLRKGFRFRGTAEVLPPEADTERFLHFFSHMGVDRAKERIRSVVLIRVETAAPLVSPAYDTGLSEEEVRTRWRVYYNRLAAGETDLPDPA